MATIPGSKSGTRPYLELDWSVNSQDIANNRSSVNLKLYLKVDYAIGYSARYTGTLYGSSFTSSSGYISKPGRYLLTQRDVWIGHNSDGSKTVTLTADYNLNITWGGTYFGKITLSGSANLGTIPRASTISAFSFGAALKNGVVNSIKYTVDRKSGNFRHQIQLKDGNTTVWTWDNQNTDGANTIELTAANVNTLLGRMKTVTSKTFTLRIATRSGASGGWIGSAVSKTAKATVHADVKPTVSAVTVSQTGNSVSTHYLQGKSKVKASFTPTAVGGATIVSSSITVRRKTSNTDVQTINSNSGTTGKAVRLYGTYQAQGTTRDSRGRVNNTAWAEFTVTAYSAPTITNFSAARNGTTATTVNISRATTHTVLGTSNHLTYSIQRKQGTGAWTNVNTGATGSITTSGATGSATSTGNSVTTSYDFRMVITDKFGESAESVVSVSTQRVVLDVHKNEGVGIGKIHEKGVLDVDGEVHLRGSMSMTGVPTGGPSGNDFQFELNPDFGNAAIELGSYTTKSTPFIDFHSSGNGNDYDSRISASFGGSGSTGTGDMTITASTLNLNGRESVRINSNEVAESGKTNTGSWVKLYNGVLICWTTTSEATASSAIGSLFGGSVPTWSFPHNFINSDISISFGLDRSVSGGAPVGVRWNSPSTSQLSGIYLMGAQNTTKAKVSLMAMGWWK